LQYSIYTNSERATHEHSNDTKVDFVLANVASMVAAQQAERKKEQLERQKQQRKEKQQV
jgi:hypothetical protein